MLARSRDGGVTWTTYKPVNYINRQSPKQVNAVPLTKGVDFSNPGFVMRTEGHGYHGNANQQWFYSLDKGQNWSGPYVFGYLFDHPELTGKQFTARTSYLVNGPLNCFLFNSVRSLGIPGHQVSLTDKVFLTQTINGGQSFQFVSWVVPPTDGSRAVMPAPVRLSTSTIVAAIRRRNDNFPSCWIDLYQSKDNGQQWSFLTRIGETGGHNGNPPALVRMDDGRLCCVYGNRDLAVIVAKFSADGGLTWGSEMILRDDFQSINGFRDLGYPRLFQRPDGKLITAYFWCSPERPETHIAATIFDAPKD
jgi:hypothetical protein